MLSQMRSERLACLSELCPSTTYDRPAEAILQVRFFEERKKRASIQPFC